MIKRTTGKKAIGRSILLAGIAYTATLFGASTALAGDCPAGNMKAGVRPPVSHAGKGVTDKTLAAIDLEKEPANIKGRQLRFRKLTIEPGGVVPWHSHDDRPAIIFIAEGEVIEYASNCSEPLVHKAGDIRSETHGVAHWWENKGNKTAVLYAADVLHDKTDKNM